MRCLDTNVFIAVLNDSSPNVTARFGSLVHLGDLAMPVIVLHELEYGLAKSTRRAAAALRLRKLLALPLAILPFEPPDAEHAADIRADLKRRGTPIGPYDTLIAAQARCRGATLVTANTREFARVTGLALEDWT